MGRAKKVLEKLEEKTRVNGMHKLALAVRKQSTGTAIDVSPSILIQLGTVIQGVGVVTDVDVIHNGHYVQVKYTVSGTASAMGSMQYTSSSELIGVSGVDSAMNEDTMRLHIKGVLQEYVHAKSTHIQHMIHEDAYDITSLVDALVSCESTLQSVYALTQIAAAMDDVDYHRFINSLRTMMIDESGVEPNADSQSTPHNNSDGTGTSVGDGLSETQEKNDGLDHMDGVAKEKIRVECTFCHAGQLFDNGVCKVCGRDLSYPTQYADVGGQRVHPVLCGGCHKYYMDDKDACPGCHTPRDDKSMLIEVMTEDTSRLIANRIVKP